MPYESHSVCIVPLDPGVSIWRYMNLAKFLEMMESQCLHFAQVNTLNDPFEGSLPPQSIADYNARWVNPDNTGATAQAFARMHYTINQYYTYVNCWHMKEYESAAMWSQYSADGIAIKSTFQRLADSISQSPKAIHISLIQYSDYRSHIINYGNTLGPIISKRQSFEYESEIRAIYVNPPTATDSRPIEDKVEEQPKGFKVRGQLEMLIESVYVAPNRPKWFGALIQSLVKRYEYDFPVIASDLESRPTFG